MNDHNHCHDQSQDVHEVIGGLEDERVCDLNRPGIAFSLDAHSVVDRLVAHKGAQRYRGLCAYCLEVAETHLRWREGRCVVSLDG